MTKMVEVTQEDANNYCRVLTALGMEEEGDPVATIERLRARLDGALFVLRMVDMNNRIDAGEKGKAWSGRFVADEVRKALALGSSAEQQHGVDCDKAPHRGGNLHAESDDTPFDVDGVSYCGRCHKAL